MPHRSELSKMHSATPSSNGNRGENPEGFSRHFAWRKHGRKKLVGYCPALDLEVAIVRVSSGAAPGYTIEAKLRNANLNIGQKFPKFAESLKGQHSEFSSAWGFFMRAFDGFAQKLLEAQQEAAQPQEEAVQP